MFHGSQARTPEKHKYASMASYLATQKEAIAADFEKESEGLNSFEDGSAKFKGWIVAKLDRGRRGRFDYVLRVRLGRDAGKFAVGRICKVSKVVSGNKMTKTYNAEMKQVKGGLGKDWKGCTEFHVCDKASRAWDAEDEKSADANYDVLARGGAVSNIDWN